MAVSVSDLAAWAGKLSDGELGAAVGINCTVIGEATAEIVAGQEWARSHRERAEARLLAVLDELARRRKGDAARGL